MIFSESNKARFLQMLLDDGAPLELAQRQIRRLERNDFGMDDYLANRIGSIRLLVTDEQWWNLFDAGQEAKHWGKLSQEWKDLIEKHEAEQAEQQRAAGL